MACTALGAICAEAEVNAFEAAIVLWCQPYPPDTTEAIYERALANLERARAEFDVALAAYAREYAEGEMADAGAED